MPRDIIYFDAPIELTPEEFEAISGVRLPPLEAVHRSDLVCTGIDHERGVITFSSETKKGP